MTLRSRGKDIVHLKNLYLKELDGEIAYLCKNRQTLKEIRGLASTFTKEELIQIWENHFSEPVAAAYQKMWGVKKRKFKGRNERLLWREHYNKRKYQFLLNAKDAQITARNAASKGVTDYVPKHKRPGFMKTFERPLKTDPRYGGMIINRNSSRDPEKLGPFGKKDEEHAVNVLRSHIRALEGRQRVQFIKRIVEAE